MINLLPPGYRENIVYGRKNKRTLSWLLATAFGIGALLVVMMVGKLTFGVATSQAQSQKETIKAETSSGKLDSIDKEYTAFIDGLSGVKKVYQQQILYSRLIQKLATLLPPGARLASISLTDSDRAITLDFNNEQDNLGPTIQVNLQNQGEYIAQQTRSLIPSAFGISLAGKMNTASNGSQQAEVGVDSATRKLTYYINETSTDKLDRFKKALVNGGEFAYQLVLPSLTSAGYTLKTAGHPVLDSYSVDTQNKRLDYYFQANSLTELGPVKQLLDKNSSTPFAETFVFDDRDYMFARKCSSPDDSGKTVQTCKVICENGEETCDYENKVCRPLQPNGCHYILRGYYDELYASSNIALVSSQESQTCISEGHPCTHKITAEYSQLFEKIDINKVSSCQKDSNGSFTCQVEMRAQFAPNAKFYLISNQVGA